jgi:glycosyltransferase involved in cell wall biosynthesis
MVTLAPPQMRTTADAPRVRPLNIFVIHASDLVTDHRPHGDGTVAWGFIRELGRRGHRVHVACEDIDLAEAPPPTVTLHRIPLRARYGAARTAEYVVRCRLLFERLNRRERFDVAHQLNPVFGGLSLALAGTRVPLVLGTYVAAWPCGWDGLPLAPEPPLRARARRALLWLQQRNAAALLATTNAAIESKIVDVPAVRARIRRLHHGIDPADYAPNTAGHERERALRSERILFLANVGIRKGIFTLLEAFAAVHAVRPGALLVIGGDGPTLSDVRERAVSLGVGDAVEFRGNVARSDVAAFLHGGAVYCLPSFGEPYGMTAIEAMAAGLPLVVSANGGLAEVVDSGGAIAVEPGNAAALRDALVAVLESPERARMMGDHNMQRVRDHFSWPVVVDTLESVYAGVCRSRGVQQ